MKNTQIKAKLKRQTRKYKPFEYLYLNPEDLEILFCSRCAQEARKIMGGKLVYVQKGQSLRTREMVERILEMRRQGLGYKEMREKLELKSAPALSYWLKKANEEQRPPRDFF